MMDKLAIVIIQKAVDDWTAVCTHSEGNERRRIARVMKYGSVRDELMDFFKSDWAKFLFVCCGLNYKSSIDALGILSADGERCFRNRI